MGDTLTRRGGGVLCALVLGFGAALGLPGIAWAAGDVPSDTALTASPDPGRTGAPLTYTATITGSGDSPTGTVEFSEQVCSGGGEGGEDGGVCTGAQPLGTATVANGVATLTVTPSEPGVHYVTATYSGNDTYTVSDRTIQVRVDGSDGPVVSSVTPTSGPTGGGTVVRLAGSGFGGTRTVTIDGQPVAFTVTSDRTRITFRTPPHVSATVDVVVTTLRGSVTTRFTYVEPRKPPHIDAISPTVGPAAGGTVVRLTGTEFGGVRLLTVDDRSVPFTVAPDRTRITFRAPAHAAGAVSVVVTGPGGASKPVSYTYR